LWLSGAPTLWQRHWPDVKRRFRPRMRQPGLLRSQTPARRRVAASR